MIGLNSIELLGLWGFPSIKYEKLFASHWLMDGIQMNRLVIICVMVAGIAKADTYTSFTSSSAPSNPRCEVKVIDGWIPCEKYKGSLYEEIEKLEKRVAEVERQSMIRDLEIKDQIKQMYESMIKIHAPTINPHPFGQETESK